LDKEWEKEFKAGTPKDDDKYYGAGPERYFERQQNEVFDGS